MKKKIFLISLWVLLVLGCNIQAIYADEEAGEEKDSSLKQIDSSIQADQEYKIGSGDILEIMTWKEPDFTRAGILVRIDGKITFPLLGDVQASGLTPVQLKNQIEAELKAYVSDPAVTVSITSPGSQRFYILGEVARTGEYNITKHLTILQAFALAGGFTEWASKKEIILLRYEEGKEKIIRVNYKNIVKGKDLSQNIKIKANDTIIVP
ncbi:polysaccharide biosynthesis/export family protein [Thermodesulfobacteriota bacterium]